jgi:hypothetical protein
MDVTAHAQDSTTASRPAAWSFMSCISTNDDASNYFLFSLLPQDAMTIVAIVLVAAVTRLSSDHGY